jgi:arginine exporter protein ArgO
MLFLYVLGTINGIGYSCWISEYVTAVGVAVLSFMAWPTAKDYFNQLYYQK